MSTDGVIRGLDGQIIPVIGQVALEVALGETVSTMDVWVAHIQEECILGADFLKKEGCIIDYPRQTLRIGETEIPLRTGGEELKCLRVVLDKAVKVPPFTEMIIPAKLEGDRGGVRWGTTGPPNLVRRDGDIVVGRTVVDLDKDYIPVRVGNLSSGRKKLKKGTEIAVCEAAASITATNMASEGKENLQTSKKEPVPDYLQSLYESSTENLCDRDKEKVAELLVCFQDVFSQGLDDLGRATGVRHDIVTGNAAPVKQPPRRIPVSKREEASKAIKDMEKQGIVEPSTSPWSSPVVLVRKKDGSTRFCVDYRRLNDVTRKDSFPLPRIDATLDALNGASWFSTLDLKSGYWQVELESSAKEKTAFSAGKGLYQFKVMPFGLCNAPATFERLMEAVLAGLPWETCLVYLDDIIVHAADFKSHIKNLRLVLEKLRQANLKLNPKKCKLFQQQVQFLGYTVSKHGISADQEKVKAVQNWPQPTNVREVKSYLGLCTYYRRFVPGFANIAKPLHLLTEKNARFQWTNECEAAFKSLKQHLTKTPTLAYPDFQKSFILDTDASNVAIGGVLSQIVDGAERPIAYFSKTLSKPESQCRTPRWKASWKR
jgi:hypothetical protein